MASYIIRKCIPISLITNPQQAKTLKKLLKILVLNFSTQYFRSYKILLCKFKVSLVIKAIKYIIYLFNLNIYMEIVYPF